jgi:HlyD family secretion protein
VNHDARNNTVRPGSRQGSPVGPRLVALLPAARRPRRRFGDRLSFRAAAALLLVAVVVVGAVVTRDAVVKAPPPRPCETAVVTDGPIAGTLRLPGRLSTSGTVRIGSGKPGLVVAVPVSVGARVSKGQVLARLDDTEQRAALAGADAQLTSAELAGIRAERELHAEIHRRQEQGLLPELPSFDEIAEGPLGDAQLEYLHGAAQIARQEQALAAARMLVARRVVRAPIDGIVLARNIEPGETIPASPPGPPLFVIGSDPRRLRLEAEVDERYLHAVLPGPASFVVPAFGGYDFPATVVTVERSATAVRSPAPYVVVLDAANADGALQPGMSAIVELAMATRQDTLSVPTGALFALGGSTVAWFPDDHGRPAPKAVTVGVANADVSEVESPGLAAGRLVVNDRSPTTCVVSP